MSLVAVADLQTDQGLTAGPSAKLSEARNQNGATANGEFSEPKLTKMSIKASTVVTRIKDSVVQLSHPFFSAGAVLSNTLYSSFRILQLVHHCYDPCRCCMTFCHVLLTRDGVYTVRQQHTTSWVCSSYKWCITLRITGCLDSVHRPEFHILENSQ